jgi:superfamily I DNA/RNA helicase
LGDLTALVARLQNELLKAKDREIELQGQLANQASVMPAVVPTMPKVDSAPPPVALQPSPKSTSPLLVRRQKHLKEWDVKNPDEDQLALIEKTLDKSMLIAGCAGSGKSVIALHKAMKIHEAGGDVILIAFTKSLNRYMEAGRTDNGLGKRFFYHWQWKHEGMPKADYVIVDEIQDFTRSEIEEFMSAANKSYFFFGDTAQSIYGKIRPGTLTVEEISDLTGLKILRLYNNYRLPKPVAQITQTYVGVDVNPYEEAVYQSKERERPRFLMFESVAKQADAIVALINKNKWRNVGILLPSNSAVCEMYGYLQERHLMCESKYESKNSANYGNDEQDFPQTSNDSLNFRSENPKVMTYHSAKGLQFETVILPMFVEAKSQAARKALYVAMTRTYRNLYVMYTGKLGAPLSNVPDHLYISKE